MWVDDENDNKIKYKKWMKVSVKVTDESWVGRWGLCVITLFTMNGMITGTMLSVAGFSSSYLGYLGSIVILPVSVIGK